MSLYDVLFILLYFFCFKQSTSRLPNYFTTSSESLEDIGTLLTYMYMYMYNNVHVHCTCRVCALQLTVCDLCGSIVTVYTYTYSTCIHVGLNVSKDRRIASTRTNNISLVNHYTCTCTCIIYTLLYYYM